MYHTVGLPSATGLTCPALAVSPPCSAIGAAWGWYATQLCRVTGQAGPRQPYLPHTCRVQRLCLPSRRVCRQPPLATLLRRPRLARLAVTAVHSQRYRVLVPVARASSLALACLRCVRHQAAGARRLGSEAMAVGLGSIHKDGGVAPWGL